MIFLRADERCGTDTKQIICFKNLLVTAFQHQFEKNAKKMFGNEQGI